MNNIIYKIIIFPMLILIFITCSSPTGPEKNNILKIVYSASNSEISDIFIMNINAENKINLTSEVEKSSYNPAFTPNCKKIIFRSRSNYPNNQLFSIDIDGKNLNNISNNDLNVFYHDVAIERNRIVFGELDSENIWIMDTDGSNQKNLTNNYGNWYPKISPNGEHIVFQKYGNYYHDNIYIIDAGGNNLNQLTDNSREDTWPQFTKDGNYILYLSTIIYPDILVDRFDIYRMDIDGSNKINLTSDIGSAASPASSPDGQKILFVVNSEIYIMDIDGQNKINLSNGNGQDILPQFSPDMDRVVFISEVEGNKELYIMDIDGSNRVRLTNTTLNESSPIFCY